MTITGGTALPRDEIDRMVHGAEQHAEEDRRRREAAEARNQADQLAYQTDRLLKEHGEQLPADLKARVESAVGELREALKGDDIGQIRAKSDAVMAVSQEIGQAIYAASQQAGAAAGAGAGAGTGAGGTEDVVDAEVVEEGGDQEAAS